MSHKANQLTGMGSGALHGEPFDLEVMAPGKNRFFISLFDNTAFNENQPEAVQVSFGAEREVAWRRIVAGSELPHDCSSLNKM